MFGPTHRDMMQSRQYRRCAMLLRDIFIDQAGTQYRRSRQAACDRVSGHHRIAQKSRLDSGEARRWGYICYWLIAFHIGKMRAFSWVFKHSIQCVEPFTPSLQGVISFPLCDSIGWPLQAQSGCVLLQWSSPRRRCDAGDIVVNPKELS